MEIGVIFYVHTWSALHERVLCRMLSSSREAATEGVSVQQTMKQIHKQQLIDPGTLRQTIYVANGTKE